MTCPVNVASGSVFDIGIGKVALYEGGLFGGTINVRSDAQLIAQSGFNTCLFDRPLSLNIILGYMEFIDQGELNGGGFAPV
jgi:hypothetical protein